MKLLGIDIGGTKTAVLIGTNQPSIIERHVFTTLPTWQATIDEIINQAKLLLKKHGDVVSIGISCGGPLSSEKGLIMSPPNLPNWENVPICELLSHALGNLPCYLENDANACAWAEYLWGAGQGSNHMAFLTFGTGMGAGLVLNGQLYRGANDMAGEVGHIRLSKTGPEGYGKVGSFEGFCSGGGLARLANYQIEQDSNSPNVKDFLSFLKDRPLTALELSIAAQNGITFALDIFSQSGTRLGQALAILIDILNLERIVIGSMYVRMSDYFLPSMLSTINSEALSYSKDVCQIVKAQLGEQIGDFAALGVSISKQ